MPPKPRTNSPAPYECSSANCKAKIKSTFEASLHPLIGTLMCRKCYKSYGDGNFANLEEGVDDQGDDNFCRWCVDGGDLFGCSNEKARDNDRCHYSFCRDCIARNVPEDPILEPNGNNNPWYCYACKPEKLAHLRESAQSALRDLNERENRQRQLNKKETKDKPNEQSETIELQKKEPLLREKSKFHPTTPVYSPQHVKQKPLILQRPHNRVQQSESAKKEIIKEKPKDQSQKESNNKEVTRDKTKDQQQNDINKKESSKDKNKEQSQQEIIKTPVQKSKDIQQQASNKETPKEKSNQQNLTDANKKSVSNSKESLQDKAKEPSPSLVNKPQNQTSQQQPASFPPKEFIKDVQSYNQIKKRKLSNSSRVDTPSKVLNKAYQDCFGPAFSVRTETPVVKLASMTNEDVIKRFEEYKKVGHNCVREIDIKLSKIGEMLKSDKEASDSKKKKLINDEIESLNTPFTEFFVFIKDLKRLNNLSS